MADSAITIIVKPTAGGEKFQVVASTDDTIAELKTKVRTFCMEYGMPPFARPRFLMPLSCLQVAEKCSIVAAEQRLIYKGQVLKDERDIKSYGALSEIFDCQTAAARISACSCSPHGGPAGLENEHVIHLVKGRPASTAPR